MNSRCEKPLLRHSLQRFRIRTFELPLANMKMKCRLRQKDLCAVVAASSLVRQISIKSMMQIILYCLYKVALITVADTKIPGISVRHVMQLLVEETFLNCPQRILSMLPCASTIRLHWKILQQSKSVSLQNAIPSVLSSNCDLEAIRLPPLTMHCEVI